MVDIWAVVVLLTLLWPEVVLMTCSTAPVEEWINTSALLTEIFIVDKGVKTSKQHAYYGYARQVYVYK